MARQHNKLISLLTPSYLSAGLTSTAALVIMMFTYFKSHATASSLAEGLQGFQLIFTPLYHRLTDSLSHNSILSNLPLLLFWSVVGAIVYLIAVRIYVAISDTADLEKTLTYANVRRNSLIETVLISTGLRLAALFTWCLYWALLLKLIFPRFVVAGSITEIITGLIVVIITLHIHVIFLRLIALRVRIFSSAD